MTAANQMDREVEIRVRREAVATAKAMLRGELGLIEGGRYLSALSHYLLRQIPPEDELSVFDELDLEARLVPADTPREQWDAATRAEADAIVRRIETLSRPELEAACRSVISRFSNGGNGDESPTAR
jgi:hypothetical protein